MRLRLQCGTHDHPVVAGHRPVQVHHDAGRAAPLSRRAGRVPVQVPHRGRQPASASRRDPRGDRGALRAQVPRRRARVPAQSALHEVGLRRLPGPVPVQREVPAARRGRGPGGDRHHDPRPLAAHHPVRDPGPRPDLDAGRRRLQAKIDLVRTVEPELEFKISDFGTRRRFSGAWHEEVLQTLKREMPQYFAGSSNVWFAMRNNLTPLGTLGHEYMQACQALGPRLRDSQTFAFDKWAQEYRGDLGIAISDTYGVEAFLRDFDMYFCKLFDGARHDSGDPFDWGEKMIAHYRRNRVDPRTKTLIFSDQLSFPLAIGIARRFHGRAKTAFGIGTNLTNDLGYEPINIVLKMTECNGQPVAKLSDAPGKTISTDAGYLRYLRQVFGLEPAEKI